MTSRRALTEAKRIVIKVGTSTLTHKTGQLNIHRIELLVRQIVDCKNMGKEVILVSSGAVGAGMSRMHLEKKPDDLIKKQALAAIGQGILIQIYGKLFGEYGQSIAQVLLTRENSIRYEQYINSRRTLLELLSCGVIPIVNENDVVATDELKIGDNDTLAATVATLVDADAVILLTDIDGLFDKDPHHFSDAMLLSEIESITPEIEKRAGGAGSRFGTGGMFTKIQAAKIATAAGIPLLIVNGKSHSIIGDVLNGAQKGTIFLSQSTHLKRKKSWLAFGKQISGSITIDRGCLKALQNGSSLLAAGIISVSDDFAAGCTIRILSEDGQEIARGITNYSSKILQQVMGHQSHEFSDLCPEQLADEAIHRDNMVLLI